MAKKGKKAEVAVLDAKLKGDCKFDILTNLVVNLATAVEYMMRSDNCEYATNLLKDIKDDLVSLG